MKRLVILFSLTFELDLLYASWASLFTQPYHKSTHCLYLLSKVIFGIHSYSRFFDSQEQDDEGDDDDDDEGDTNVSIHS